MSEVTQLREQIEQVCASLNLIMHGYAIAARHDIITHKYEQLEALQSSLSQEIGPQAAIEFVIASIDAQLK
jgi:hypothetical protein